MSELAVLFAIVAGIYLFQCICWAPVQATVFRAGILLSGKRVRRGLVWNALHMAAFWANPLPVDSLVVVNSPTAALNPTGLQPEGASEAIPWERISLRRAGSRLLSNDLLVLRGPKAQLNAFEELLRRIALAKPAGRSAVIERWLAKSTEPRAADERLQKFREQARFMAVLTSLQWLLLFGITPLMFTRFGPRGIWMALGLVAAASVAITIEFWMLHKALYPEQKNSRLTSAVTVLLSPLSAIRTLDVMGRDVLAGIHPVAAASAVCSTHEFAVIAGEYLRDLSFGGCAGTWYAEKSKEHLRRLIAAKGLSANKLMAPPQRQEECAFYCPRCLAQYLAAPSECADCGYEELAKF